MGSKRRFHPIGKEVVYDHFFDLFRVQSEILNQSSVPNMSTVFYDKEGLLDAVRKLKGDENGQYIRGNEKQLSDISLQKLNLRRVDETFNSFCKQRINSGFAKPEKMPIELHEEQMKLFARLDVLTEELETVENKLGGIIEIEKQEDENLILCYGLRGIGKLRDGILVQLDGQRIIQNEEDLLIIANGPYKGMAVTGYRTLCNRWQADRKEAAIKQLLHLQETAKSENRSAPMNLPISSMKKVSRASLPDFPADFERHDL